MSDCALRIVLRHKFFHFAARADTALDTPRWLTECVADYMGAPCCAQPRSCVGGNAGEDANGRRLRVVRAATSLAYDRAWWFARFIADTYGNATLRTLYLRVGGNGHQDPRLQ